MTELMKRFEAETGDSFLQAMEFNKVSYYISCYKAWLEREYHILEAENAQLKDQLRWRPVSEEPKEYGWYFVEAEYIDGTRGYESCRFVNRDGVKQWFGLKVVRWLLIPPAPEGE